MEGKSYKVQQITIQSTRDTPLSSNCIYIIENNVMQKSHEQANYYSQAVTEHIII